MEGILLEFLKHPEGIVVSQKRGVVVCLPTLLFLVETASPRWEPSMGRRSWGRPVLRWGSALGQFATAKKLNWLEAAKDPGNWGALEDEFAAKRW